MAADMIKRRSLRTRNIKMFILDEADEMLNKGLFISFPRTIIFTQVVECSNIRQLHALLSVQVSKNKFMTCIGTCLLQPRSVY